MKELQSKLKVATDSLSVLTASVAHRKALYFQCNAALTTSSPFPLLHPAVANSPRTPPFFSQPCSILNQELQTQVSIRTRYIDIITIPAMISQFIIYILKSLKDYILTHLLNLIRNTKNKLQTER